MAVYTGGAGNDVIVAADDTTGALTALYAPGASSPATYSKDGSKLVFMAYVNGGTSHQVLVRDEATGSLYIASRTTPGGGQGESSAEVQALTGDATKIVFTSAADNLVSGDTNGESDIFITNLITGVSQRLSVNSLLAQGNGPSYDAVIGANGRYVAFSTDATNMADHDPNGGLMVVDMTGGSPFLVSRSHGGDPGNGASFGAAFSPDGNKILYSSYATNLVAGDTNGAADVLLFDFNGGGTTRISTTAAGAQANGDSISAQFSPDGKKVVFTSYATNLVSGDTNGATDLFIKDLATGAVTRVSTNSQGQQANGDSNGAIFTPDGHGIIFHSAASDLVAGDTNGVTDLFLKDLDTGRVTRLSTDGAGGQLSAAVYDFAISPDGLKIAFSAGGVLYEKMLPSGPGDTLYGGNGADTLGGGFGDDLLFGGAGNDLLIGGGGTDTVSYADATGKVTVNLNLASHQVTGGGGTDTLVSIENIIGSNFDDILQGDSGDNVLDGGAGVDTVSYASVGYSGVVVSLSVSGPQWTHGDAGTDTLINIENITGSSGGDFLEGDGGANVLDGAGGVDQVSYAHATAAVTVSLAITTAQNTGGAGIDTIKNFEWLEGSAFDDMLTGSTKNDVLYGGAGSDHLYGGAGADALLGGEGDDVMDGGAGDDQYVVDSLGDQIIEAASGGIDQVSSKLTTYTLGANLENLSFNGSAPLTWSTSFTGIGNSLNNRISGADGDDNLYGMDGDDTLYGGWGNDHLYGGAGKDTLDGTVGADVMAGGAGDDTYWVDQSDDVIQEDVNGGVDTVMAATSSYTLSANVENLKGVGGGAFVGIGNAGANTITGGGSLYGMDGDDKLYIVGNGGHLYGGAGNDTLYGGTSFPDDTIMEGGAGNDTYVFYDANPVLIEQAGEGTDTVRVYVGAYTLGANLENLNYLGSAFYTFTGTGNELANSITAGGNDDTLYGLAGDDKLSGLDGADHLYGGDGKDTLDGGLGADLMDGGLGDDTYVVDDAGDQIVEAAGAGADTVKTAFAAYVLADNLENLTYTGASAFTGTGNAAANTLTGGAGDDLLSGLAGNDKLNGGAGADVLNGGLGQDTLTGGAGADTFVFAATAESAAAAADTVADFSSAQGDIIDLTAIDADTGAAGDQAFSFIGTAAFSHHAGELRYFVSGSTLTIQGDINGDGVADFAIKLSNLAALSASDFHP